MTYRITSHFNRVDLHQAPIDQVTIGSDWIKLCCLSAKLNDDHPINPFMGAQSIQHCMITFHQVVQTDALVWSDAENRYLAHPDPNKPLANYLFGATQLGRRNGYNRFSIKGWHPLGRVDWLITCARFDLTWHSFGPSKRTKTA